MARPARPGAREALLDAARAEFGKSGLERARVEDVARRAGLSKGAFYLHFATKEAAFEELVHRYFGALEDQGRRRDEAQAEFERTQSGRTGQELYAAQLDMDCTCDEAVLDVLWRNRHVTAALDTAGLRYAEMLNAFRRRMREDVVRRVAEKQRLGRLRADVDADVVGDILLGTYESLGRRMIHLRDKPDLTAWIRSFLRILYEGLAERSALGVAPQAPRARATRR
jgi:AcrR family transcriptional regulator